MILLVCSSWMIAAPAVASDETADLQRAIQLFDEGEYLTTQELLVSIDRTKLNAEQQALRDNYLSRVQVAITMKEKALRDLEDAETALAEDEPEQAERLLGRVLTNKYAPLPVLRSARTHLRDLAGPAVLEQPLTAEPAEEAHRLPEIPTPQLPARRVEDVRPELEGQLQVEEASATDQPRSDQRPAEEKVVTPPQQPEEEVRTPAVQPVEREQLPADLPKERQPPTAEPHAQDLPPIEPLVDEAGTVQARTEAEIPQPVDEFVDTVPAATVQFQRARVLTEEADQLVHAAQYDKARRLYEGALRAVPGYPEAVAGLTQLRDHERNVAGTRAESLIERIQREDQINWQRTVAEFRDVATTIRGHVSNHRFDEAHQLLHRCRQIVAAGRQYADPVTKYESLRDELEGLDSFVRSEERTFNQDSVAQTRREIEGQRKRRLLEIEDRRRQQVESLMTQALQHRKDGALDAAIGVLQQVIVIDPKHKPARWLMDTLDELLQYRIGRQARKDLYEQTQKTLNEVERAKIPWEQQLRFPKDWPERISRPGRQRPGRPRRSVRLMSALDKRIPVDFANEPFSEVLGRLADAHRLNIIVNWNDLKRAGVERSVPIDLYLPQQITLKKALTEVLEQAGAGIVRIDYEVAEDTIKIATRDTLDRDTYIAVYDINDLLMEIPMYNDPPVMDLARVTRQGRLQLNERTDLPWRYGDDDDDEPEEDPRRAGRVQKLINLIQETVAPDTWVDRGGSIGTMKEINGQLVVTQNSATQRQIGSLLDKLREQRTIQIAIEARFLTVTSNYLEELGVDLDIVLNGGNAGFDFVPAGLGPLTDPVLGNTLLLPRSFSRLGISPDVPGGLGQALVGNNPLAQPFGSAVFVPPQGGGSGSRVTPFPIINRVGAFTDPLTLGSDVPGSFAGGGVGPAFSLFGSFLDNIQVDFLIRATQADSRSTVLTAPRLVLFNGQNSWIAVTLSQNFISQLTPVVATGAAAQAPTTQTIPSGAILNVLATVTADKRYVTMNLQPSVSRLISLQTIPFSGGSDALNAFIQLPLVSAQQIQTTVSVPDGGTLLIGGQKLASETEVEAGVPILSKIPILKRLYTSRTMIKDEQTLLILIKPTIIIAPEQEELAFPSFREP